MKKTLAALAVLGAFAGSAFAADVTLYGLVDYGFNYMHADTDQANVDATDKFEMRSGMNSGSRFGLKGTEDLGNGLKVGFVLENGFDADTGALGNGGRLFGRESQITLSGAFGALSFGRMGQLASANGTYGLLNGTFSPFSGGWADSVGAKFLFANGYDRYDNMITYATPEFAGLKVFAQYSFKNDGTADGDEGKSSADRYYGIGAKYTNGGLNLVAIVDSMNYKAPANNDYDPDDQMTATVGGSYDFGFMTVYALGQYFDNARRVGNYSVFGSDGVFDGSKGYGYVPGYSAELEGYGITLAASAPVFGGTAMAQLGYMDADNNGGKMGEQHGWDVSRWNVTVGYSYNLSKRTSVYSAASYTKDSVELNGGKGNDTVYYDGDPSSVQVIAGLIHRF